MSVDIMPRDTNFAFNLSHVRMSNSESECLIDKLDEGILSDILSFLPTKEAIWLNSVNKKWRVSVSMSWDKKLSLFIAEIENLKIYNSDRLFRKIQFLYETGGFFSPSLHLLDQLLYHERSFISKYHVEEMKSIFKPLKAVK